MDQESIFRALADVSRRKLLDLLYLKDGRSLTELEEHLPMTRFGVMKHLKILKNAGLVTTRKAGRETLHYLNAVPIQMVYERWVSKYAKGWAQSLTELKYDLEDETPLTRQAVWIKQNNMEANMAEAAMAETIKQVFEIYIRTTPERLWQALTEGSFTEKYYFGSRVESDWKTGSDYKYLTTDKDVMIEGRVIESMPPTRLVTTFIPRWSPETKTETMESIVTYEIESIGNACRLTLVHEGLVVGNPITEGVRRGWSSILSSLKTLLETGEPLTLAPGK